MDGDRLKDLRIIGHGPEIESYKSGIRGEVAHGGCNRENRHVGREPDEICNTSELRTAVIIDVNRIGNIAADRDGLDRGDH